MRPRAGARPHLAAWLIGKLEEKCAIQPNFDAIAVFGVELIGEDLAARGDGGVESLDPKVTTMGNPPGLHKKTAVHRRCSPHQRKNSDIRTNLGVKCKIAAR